MKQSIEEELREEIKILEAEIEVKDKLLDVFINFVECFTREPEPEGEP
jgi:hypothetical protein